MLLAVGGGGDGDLFLASSDCSSLERGGVFLEPDLGVQERARGPFFNAFDIPARSNMCATGVRSIVPPSPKLKNCGCIP